MSRYNKTRILKVNAKIECEGLSLNKVHEIGFDHNIRLRWRVKNNSNEQIWLLGYYALLFHNSVEMGIYDNRSSEFINKVRYISNDHVKVLLYPDETREYVWAWQSPWEYGMKDEGEWKYNIHMHYSIGGVHGETGPAMAKIILKEKSRKVIDEHMRIRAILRKGQVIRLLNKHIRGISPLLDDESSQKFKAGSIGYIDFLGKTSSGPVVVEVKRLVDEISVFQLLEYMKWAQDVLGPRFGTGTKGILIGIEFTKEAIKHVNFSEKEIHLFKFEDDSLIRIEP